MGGCVPRDASRYPKEPRSHIMRSRTIAAGAVTLAALIGAACAPPKEPPTPRIGTAIRVCSTDPTAVITMIEGTPLGCDVVPPQRLDVRMVPNGGVPWWERCADDGGTVDTTSDADYLCRGVDY